LPTSFSIHENGVRIQFSERLEKSSAEDAESYSVEQWNYRWSKDYGSADYLPGDSQKKGREKVPVSKARLEEDGKTVLLELEKVGPVHQLWIGYNLETRNAVLFQGSLATTINKVAPAR
jgi:hypothetical protein